MIKSMTGFASLSRDDEEATITATIRAVNHRFLDLQLRVPQAFAALEPRLRTLVQQRVARGRIEVSLSIQHRRIPAIEVELNGPFLEALQKALAQARADGHIDGPLTPGDLLRFPQALAIREADAAAAAGDQAARLGPRIEAAVAEALEQLDTMRSSEGAFLRAELDGRRQQLAELFDRVATAADAGVDGLKTRLSARLRELEAENFADAAALAQEIVRFASRSDITEERVRFTAHLAHWQALSDGPEPCGRKLDFLLQEMNREVNTTASKAEGPSVSELVVALKAELEKMREQVQNVE
jgi:uncharacterized protein (TIGR00255 family)